MAEYIGNHWQLILDRQVSEREWWDRAFKGLFPLYDIGLDVFEIWIDKNGDGKFTQG